MPDQTWLSSLPQRRLTAIATPVRRTPAPHRIPARLMLPMIMSPAQHKVLLGPVLGIDSVQRQIKGEGETCTKTLFLAGATWGS